MASALEVVAVCVEWARAKNILKADPVEGPWNCFSAEHMQKKFDAGHAYLGVAGNMFFFDLKVWAMDGVEVALIEAQAYANKYFKVAEALQYYAYLDAPAGSPAASPPASSQQGPKFEWQVPVCAAATGPTLQTATVGPRGKWRKISADSQAYGFLYVLATLIRKTPWTKASKTVLDLLATMARHCPMDVLPFLLTADLSKQLFLKSFQIMENFKKFEEEQGVSGWKMCCLFNQARKMVDQTKDVNDALVDFFGSIEFAATSEYRTENLKKKLGRDCLIFFDRAMTAGLAGLMPRCRIDLGPRNALDMLSKMIKISQCTAAGFEETELPGGFRCVMELLFVRMKTGITSEDIAGRSLARDEIPVLIGTVKLVRHLLEKFSFNGKAEAKVLANLDSPLAWFEGTRSSSEALMIVRPSCKALHTFITGLYAGKWDHVFREMAEVVGKRKLDTTIANHGRFRLREDIENVYNKEKQQQENAAKFAASGAPATPVVEVLAASSQEEAQGTASEAESEVDTENKEHKLKAARAKHVQAALGDAVRFVQRPALKSDFVTLFSESLLVQNRTAFRQDDETASSWRHGWLYECCADQEPKIADKSKNHIRAVSPQPDAPMAKMFFEAVLSIATENDILLAPNGRSAGASRTLLGLLSKPGSSDALNITYKEHASKGRSRLHEVVHIATTKPCGLQPARARLYYQLTTTASDSIIQAADMEATDKVEQQEKLAIMGEDNLLPTEKMLKPTEKVVLFHWEKPQEVYEEMLHHLRLTGLTTASCGRLQLLKACVNRQVKCLALYRNETHHHILQRDLFAWMLEESLTNPQTAYYLTRKDLIEQLGLTPDDSAVPGKAGGKGGAGAGHGKGGKTRAPRVRMAPRRMAARARGKRKKARARRRRRRRRQSRPTKSPRPEQAKRKQRQNPQERPKERPRARPRRRPREVQRLRRTRPRSCE